MKEYRNILYDYIKRNYREDPASKTNTDLKNKSESRHKEKRSLHHTDNPTNTNSSMYMKSPGKEMVSKYANLSKSILKEKEQIKASKDEKRNSSSYLLKKRDELLKPQASYTSKYVKEYLSAKY